MFVWTPMRATIAMSFCLPAEVVDLLTVVADAVKTDDIKSWMASRDRGLSSP